MKIHFDDGMEEANSLFLGNNKLQRIAQRLQEENEYVNTSLDTEQSLQLMIFSAN